jgi:HSP20 family protein
MIASQQTTAPSVASTTASPEAGLTYRPNVDVADCGDCLVLIADIPGSSADGIDVRFEDGVLAIDAAVPPRPAAGTAVRREYGIGCYRRSIQLGEGFDGGQIEAGYRHGVLTVRIPRLAAVQPRTIPVKSS